MSSVVCVLFRTICSDDTREEVFAPLLIHPYVDRRNRSSGRERAEEKGHFQKSMSLYRIPCSSIVVRYFVLYLSPRMQYSQASAGDETVVR